MKTLVLVLLLIIPTLCFSQKVEVSDSLITADAKPYAKIVKDNNFQYTISDLTGKPVIIIKYESTVSSSRVMAANPRGYVYYANFFFLETKQVAQSEEVMAKLKKIANEMVKNKLFIDGKLDLKAADNYILINPVVWKKG